MDVRVGLVKKAEGRRIDAFELWCWRRLLRVPWTARRSNQSILGDQSWVFFGRTDAKAETPILWPPHAKSWLIGKDSAVGRDWGQEEKGTTEDEMVGWHYRLDGQEFEWTLGVGDGQGGLARCNSWGHKELDMTDRLNWTEGATCLDLLWSRPSLFLSFVGAIVLARTNIRFNYLSSSGKTFDGLSRKLPHSSDPTSLQHCFSCPQSSPAL